MKNGNGHIGFHLLGATNDVGVQRALAEFRTGRPIVLNGKGERILALPVDGADHDAMAAFKALCRTAPLRLAITAKRAKALDIEASGPVTIGLAADDAAESIMTLAADAFVDRKLTATPAAPAAVAAIELAKLAQRLPALLIGAADAALLAALDPPLVEVEAAAVMRFRNNSLRSLTIASEAKVPLQDGVATRFVVFRDGIGGSPTAIVVGEPDFSRPVLVRLHSACLTGDVFGSRRCDCGEQLKLALSRLKEADGGIILYLEQEGRGLGIANKIRAYNLQDQGLDTVDANTTLGFEDDERDYSVAARMLEMLGCKRVFVLTNNPEKLEGLAEAGLEIAGRVPLYTPMNADNQRYLTAKATRAGHWLDGLLAQANETTIADMPDAERAPPG
jgi:GTP cyclohydrolase II